jgi:hypothetical protein
MHYSITGSSIRRELKVRECLTKEPVKTTEGIRFITNNEEVRTIEEVMNLVITQLKKDGKYRVNAKVLMKNTPEEFFDIIFRESEKYPYYWLNSLVNSVLKSHLN